jgi:putative transposase
VAKSKAKQRKLISSYVKKGIDQGRRPELVGGGLIRSLGGWSAVKALRRAGDRELSDDRILGSGEFVEQIIKEAEGKAKYQLPVKEKGRKIEEYITKLCKNAKGVKKRTKIRQPAQGGLRCSIFNCK